MTYEITGVRTLYEGWARYLKLMIRRSDGEEIGREVEDHGAAVAVLPYDPARRSAILVRQFRAPLFFAAGVPHLLEAPAGLLDEDDPADCARREAMEEVGLRLKALEPVGAVWPSPGVSTERIYLFLAPFDATDRIADGGGLADEHEDIEVTEMSLDTLWAMLEAGGIVDLKTLALVQTLRLRHPELFKARR